MWYKIAQQEQDISLQGSPSSLNDNTGFYADFSESQKLQNALKNNTFAEITSKSGKKLLGLHGNLNGEGEYCGLIAPNDWKCGEEFQQWLREKGFQNHQIITCKGGVLPNSLTNVKDPISVGLPQAPNPNDPNSPVFVSVQK
jgi:hypothetical protein